MDQQGLIESVTTALATEPTMRGLFLSGSYGRGTADAFSDVDLIALVEPDDQPGFVARWRATLEQLVTVVYWFQRGQGRVLTNAVTDEWLRCDMVILPPDALAGRARDLVRPLIDPHGMYDTLPESLPPRQPDPNVVRDLIHEFIRILGLLPLGDGRQDYITGLRGIAFQRDGLMNLMLEDLPLPDRGGALHLNKLLPFDELKVLEDLPCPRPNRVELFDAHMAIARQFMPRARLMAEKVGMVWPEAFEAAARRSVQRHFGGEFDIRW
ncbi:MAG: nucleotidyltransferase domain-containing protein [Chloroflexi bacterium]|nr:nucleotidyltransferase domain-containing protein [Chloroflexota bacterium]